MKFPWRRFKVSEEEKLESSKALNEAHEELITAHIINSDARAVGEGQRRIRAENHFGQKLAHIYRNAT